MYSKMQPLPICKETFDLFCAECIVEELGAEMRATDMMIRYKEWLRYNPGKKVMTKAVMLKMADEKYEKCAAGIYKGVSCFTDEPAPAPALPVPIPLPLPVLPSLAQEKRKVPHTIREMTCDMLRLSIHDKMTLMPIDQADNFVWDLKFWLTYYKQR